MKRVLVIALSLFTLTAVASESRPDGAVDPACNKAESASTAHRTAPTVSPAKSTGATLPGSRASSPARTTPRWNSLLPGMFR